jgi:hypothetical protein
MIILSQKLKILFQYSFSFVIAHDKTNDNLIFIFYKLFLPQSQWTSSWFNLVMVLFPFIILEFTILLPQPSECWDYRCIPPHPAFVILTKQI